MGFRTFTYIVMLCFFIIGTYQAFRRLKVKRLKPPSGVQNEFEEWQYLELTRIDILTYVAFPLPPIYYLLDHYIDRFLYYYSDSVSELDLPHIILNITYYFILLSGYTASIAYGFKAEKLKKYF